VVIYILSDRGTLGVDGKQWRYLNRRNRKHMTAVIYIEKSFQNDPSVIAGQDVHSGEAGSNTFRRFYVSSLYRIVF
jgi:hypothetical protein